MRDTFKMACRVALAAWVTFVGCATLSTPPTTIAAASPTWDWQNPLPRGYQLSAIACRSATSCVAAGFDGSIATTDDGGQHWTNRTTGIAAGVTLLSCPDRTVCYALGTQAPSIGGLSQKVHYVLLQSTDGGATWQLASHFQRNTPVSPHSFACPGPTTCLIGETVGVGQPQSASILRTADSGKTWQSVHLAGILGMQTVVCPTTTVCYAVGANNAGSTLLRSGDGGKTWSGRGLKSPHWLPAITCPGENTCFGVTSTCASGCWAIVLTTNGAKSWKTVAGNPAGHPLGALACPSVTTCYALAASGSNAYNTSIVGTTNGGKTWSVHHLPDTASDLVCPSETACFLNAGFTVLATQDGFGHTHETLARSPLHNLSLTDISCPSTTTCYAAGLRHVCNSYGGECNQVASPGAATADGGRTWTKTPAPPDLISRLSCPSAAVCYSIAGETGGWGAVERSGDGTRTWHRVFPAGGLSGLLTNLSCPTATTCYVTASMAGPGVHLAVLVTRDAGKTWTVRRGIDALAPGTAGTAGMMGRALASVTCPSITTCFVLAASFQPPPPNQNRPSQSRATVALLVTSDGGKTWTRKSVPDMNAPNGLADFTPPLACPTVTTCYLLLSNGSVIDPSSTGDVLVTHNGGASWRRMVVQAKALLTDMACPTAQACWVAGWDGIFSTADGGKTWRRQVMADGEQVQPLVSVACPAADTCYAVGGRFYAEVTIVGTRAPGGLPEGQ